MSKDIDVGRAVKEYAVIIGVPEIATLPIADALFHSMHERHLYAGEAAIIALSLAGSVFALGTEVIKLHPKEENNPQIDFENWGSE